MMGLTQLRLRATLPTKLAASNRYGLRGAGSGLVEMKSSELGLVITMVVSVVPSILELRALSVYHGSKFLYAHQAQYEAQLKHNWRPHVSRCGRCTKF